jgi:hypothetical protein
MTIQPMSFSQWLAYAILGLIILLMVPGTIRVWAVLVILLGGVMLVYKSGGSLEEISYILQHGDYPQQYYDKMKMFPGGF